MTPELLWGSVGSADFKLTPTPRLITHIQQPRITELLKAYNFTVTDNDITKQSQLQIETLRIAHACKFLQNVLHLKTQTKILFIP
jgi:hypothetical protein